MAFWICPKCGAGLLREGNSYRCAAGHSYDAAKSGYVNLLLAGDKSAREPGDNREMVAARADFLSRGHYAQMSERAALLAASLTPAGGAALDAGCGEGYYTEALSKALPESASLLAADISKAAVSRAAKRDKRVAWAVASSYRLPVEAESLDIIVTVFAPAAAREFRRALRPGGVYLAVTAGREHLLELKRVLYDEPYENPDEPPRHEGFTAEESLRLTYPFTLTTQEEILSLFSMTPYRYTTPAAGRARLAGCESLTVTADFLLTVYRRDR